MRWHLSGFLAIFVAVLPANAGTGGVFDEILERVTLRDEATGAILRVRPRADAPPNTPDLACVIVKVRVAHDPVADSYEVRLETIPGRLGGEYWMQYPGVYERYILRETARLRDEAERWAAREKALSEKERDELVGRWVWTKGDLVSVAEFKREEMTLTIEDPTYPLKSIGTGYHFVRPHPLLYEMNAGLGDVTYRFDYRRNGDSLYMKGNFGFHFHPAGGGVRTIEVPLWGYWRRKPR